MNFFLLLLAIVISYAKEATKSQFFNSHGRINVTMSSIENLATLKAALKSCSFENELVVISSSTSFADAAAQTIHMLHRCESDDQSKSCGLDNVTL